jgi:hypothetical protein
MGDTMHDPAVVLQFQKKNSRLGLVRETPYGERAEETPEENAQA